MASEWQDCRWGDLATLEYGKALRDYSDMIGDYRVYGTNGPIGYHSQPLCEHSGVIIGRKGAYRGVHYSKGPFYVIDTAFYLEPKVNFDLRWAYYYLLTQNINDMDSGSAIPSTSRADFYQLPVRFPPLPEQRAIAGILGALDDKIELNRRENATLEALAQALFKSWFVDFDPVRAKAAGQQPVGLDAATAALFPAAFAASEVGEAPLGWAVKPFSDSITLLSGGTPATSEATYWNGDIPWYSVVDAPTDSDVYVIDTEKKITEAGLANSSTRMLPTGTTIISARGTVGKCALVGRPMAMNQSCYGVCGSDGRGDYYTYYSLRALVSDLQRNSHGSVFATITRATFDGLKVAQPPVELTTAFDRTIKPFMDNILSHLYESRTLATIRDTLLPKLLSGEVRVSEVEEAVNAAM